MAAARLLEPSALSMTRNLHNFVEKSARSTIAASPVSESLRSTCRYTRLGAEEISLLADRTRHSADAICAVATRKRRSAALSFRTVLVDQSLKARVFAQPVPRRTEFEKWHGDGTWPA